MTPSQYDWACNTSGGGEAVDLDPFQISGQATPDTQQY